MAIRFYGKFTGSGIASGPFSRYSAAVIHRRAPEAAVGLGPRFPCGEENTWPRFGGASFASEILRSL